MQIPPILVAILFFVLAAYLAWRDLRLGFYLLIITLPLNNRILFTLGIPGVLPVRLVIYALFLVVSGRLYDRFIDSKTKDIKKFLSSLTGVITEYSRDPILFVLGLLLIVRVISLYNSKNLASSFNLLGFYSSIVFLYILMKYLVKVYGRGFLERLFSLYVFVAVGSGVFSLVQALYLWRYSRVLPGVWPLENEPTRFGSFFWDINHYAPYLVSVIVYLVVKGLFSKTWRSGALYWVLFFFTVGILGMTLSRSGWLGFFVAMILLLLIFLAKKLFRAAAVYMFVLLALVSVTVLGIVIYKIPVADRLYTLTRRIHSDSVIAHGLVLKGNFDVFKKYPVLGGGYGSFNEHFRQTNYAERFFKFDPVKDVRIPAHSVWFEPLSETGIVGFSLYLFLMFLVYTNLILAIKKTREKDRLIANIAILASLSGILFSGIFYSYNLEFFWIFLFFAMFFPRFEIEGLRINRTDSLIALFLVGFAAAFILPSLGKIAFIDWDESIYAEVSKNIVRYRDLISLRWKRDVLWFEKPPLYMWLTSMMYWVYEISEFTARFWSAIAGILGVVAVYFLGSLLFNRLAGFVSALTLLSIVHWIFQARNGTLDVLVATSIAFSMYFFYKARKGPGNWFWTGVFLGLTLLTKNVLVVIPLAVMVLFAIYESVLYARKDYYLNRYIFRALFAFLLVGIPWHLAAFLLHGREFIDSYLFYHVLERTKGIEGHERGIFWYLIVLRVWMRHAFVILIPSLVYFIFKAYKTIKDPKVDENNLAEVFVLLWALITFVILSASASKIQWYIMPIYPALALIIGRFLTVIFRGKLSPVLVLIMLLSVPIAFEKYRPLWDIEDFNRGIAETASYMQVLTENKKDAELLAVDLAPGPVMFYSDRPVTTVNRDGVLRLTESKEPFYALGKFGDIERIRKEFPDRDVVIFRQSGDFILYGRSRISP